MGSMNRRHLIRREEDNGDCPLTYDQADALLNDMKEIKRALWISRIVFRTVVVIVTGIAVVIDWFSGHSSFIRDSINAWLQE